MDVINGKQGLYALTKAKNDFPQCFNWLPCKDQAVAISNSDDIFKDKKLK